MTVVDTARAALAWLLADPTHIVAAASLVAAITPTPDPASPAGMFYRAIDIFALNFLHSKESGPVAAAQAGVPPAAVPGQDAARAP